jgi:hypothetical protein
MRRYKLAFGVTNFSLTYNPAPGWYQSESSNGIEKWDRKRTGEKTWVDFENDIFDLGDFGSPVRATSASIPQHYNPSKTSVPRNLTR